MKSRLLIYQINHTFLVIDITPIGIPSKILPSEGDFQMLESLRFRSWETVSDFLLKKGANQDLVDKTHRCVRSQDCTVLSIL